MVEVASQGSLLRIGVLMKARADSPLSLAKDFGAADAA